MGLIREPVVSPDGKTIAMVDGPAGPHAQRRRAQAAQPRHEEDHRPRPVAAAAARAPGPRVATGRRRLLLYVRNDRDGAKGTPRIYAYNPATKKTDGGHRSRLPASGLVAGRQVHRGDQDQRVRHGRRDPRRQDRRRSWRGLTNDGDSWAPTWSPAGDAIAYLHVAGQVVDLRLSILQGSGPAWTVEGPAGPDHECGPGQHLASGLVHRPADQLPASPAPSAAPSAVAPSPS